MSACESMYPQPDHTDTHENGNDVNAGILIMTCLLTLFIFGAGIFLYQDGIERRSYASGEEIARVAATSQCARQTINVHLQTDGPIKNGWLRGVTRECERESEEAEKERNRLAILARQRAAVTAQPLTSP